MRKSHLPLPWLALVIGATGCPTRPAANLGGFDCDPITGVCSPRDGGSPDQDGPGGGTSVQITQPTSPVYTNGSITIQIAFSPPSAAPATADLFDGDTKLGSVADPFTFVWDTGAPPAVAEGPHQITARATVAGAPISSNAVTINVDRTAPEIADRSPGVGATNVLFADPIQVVFSEPIDPATLPEAITLSSGSGAVATTSALAADGKTVTISLSDRHAITLPADVTVSVNPSVADLAGNQLGPASTWTWTAPVWVKLPMLSGKYPELALGSDDRPLVLSAVEQDAIGSNDFILQLARLGPTRAWDTTVPSPQGPRPAARVSSRAALAVGGDGLPVIAWPESQATTAAALHVAKWNGSAWHKSYGQLDGAAGSGTHTYNPAMAFSPAGNLFVSWDEANPTARAVFTARWTGTAWDNSYGTVATIGTGAVIEFGADGQPVVGFEVSTSMNGAARWTGAAWSALPNFNNYLASPALAVDAGDRPVVTSVSQQAADPYIRLLFFNSTAWMEEIPAIPVGGLQPRETQLIIPADGHPVVAWTEYDTNAGARVARVARHTGAQWDFAYGSLDGIAGTNSDGVTPRMVLDRAGSPIVAWQETDGTFQSTYVWRSNH